MLDIQNRTEFDEAIETGQVLVEVYTTVCGPCRKTKNEILPQIEDKIKVVLVNGEDHFDIAADLNVSGVPSLFLYENGKIVKSKTGFTPLESLIEFIES